MRRIGVLLAAAANDPEYQARVGAFLQALALLGWTIGGNLRIDIRWAGANAATFASTRRSWSRSRRTLSGPGAGPTVATLLQATRTVPIVFTSTPPIRSAPASSTAWRGRAATPRAS